MPLVLLAEDEPPARLEITTRLLQAGLRVLSAPDPEVLRARIDGARADLLIISAEFGRDVAGDWLAELARRPRWHDVPVIALTSVPRSLFAAALRCAGVPVLAKPVDAEALHLALAGLGLLTRPADLRIA